MWTIYYKIQSEPKLPLQVSGDWTLQTLKEHIGTAHAQSPTTLRIVKGGRLLLGDELSLDALGIQDNDTLHVAKQATNQAAAEATSPPAPQMDMDGLLENPLMQSLLSNPDIMAAMLESDPRIQKMAQVISSCGSDYEKNPEMSSVMRDPAFLKQTMDMLKNPSTRKELLRNQGSF